ncbi:hypothetical protein GOODEAATRI_028988, partial [Goodea atripinnis]
MTRVPFVVQVLDLQDRVAGLQSLNNELQSRLSQMEKSERDAFEKEDKDLTSRSRFKQVRGHKWQLPKEMDLLLMSVWSVVL